MTLNIILYLSSFLVLSDLIIFCMWCVYDGIFYHCLMGVSEVHEEEEVYERMDNNNTNMSYPSLRPVAEILLCTLVDAESDIGPTLIQSLLEYLNSTETRNEPLTDGSGMPTSFALDRDGNYCFPYVNAHLTI